MNREWMHERLQYFRKLCEAKQAEGAYEDDNRSAEIRSHLPTIREIFKRLDPELIQHLKDPGIVGGAYSSLKGVHHALGILRDQDDWAANLAPDAPSVVADQFHPHIWTAAAPLWDTGKYRVAVLQAAVSLSAHVASKAASPLTERELVQQVFAPGEPGPSQVRLHLPGDKASRNWRSRQDGLHLLAQGAFAGIRNVATHTDNEWPEQVALEHLAVLSVVARWADETEVVAAQPAAAST